MTKISSHGLTLLENLESVVKRRGKHVLYDDATGKPIRPGRRATGGTTIGYGHLVKPDERWPEDGIDERWAEDLLRADLVRFEVAVGDAINVSLNQNEFDALVIFAFNIGKSAFRTKASAVRALNAGNRADVGRRMKLWNKITVNGKKIVSAGLINRRAAEVALFYAPIEIRAKGRRPRFQGPPVKISSTTRTTKQAGFLARLFSWMKGDRTMDTILNILKGNFLSGYKTYIALIVPALVMTLNWAVGSDVTGLGAPVLGGTELAGTWWAVTSSVFLRKGLKS